MTDRTLTEDTPTGPVDWLLIGKVADEHDLIASVVKLSMDLGADVTVSVAMAGSPRYLSISTGSRDPLDEDEVSEVTARQVDLG
jgi:hypothetical protein